MFQRVCEGEGESGEPCRFHGAQGATEAGKGTDR